MKVQYSAHFDESGHPSDSDHLIVAGGLASVQQWVHFEREWKEALAPFGVSVFHTVDFEQRKPPFQNVTQQQAKELCRRLAGIICRRVEKLFSCALDMQHYRVMNERYLFAECYGAPYPLACRSCMGGIEQWCHKHFIDVAEIPFFFEDGALDKGQLEWIAERDNVPMPTFRKKAELIPLQAGDFIAWHMTQLLNCADKEEYSESVVRRLETTSHSWQTMDMSDPDRLPFLLDIPARQPHLKYKPRVIQKHGVRRAVVHFWAKDQPKDQKLDRKTLVLPDRRKLSPEELQRAMSDYAGRRQEKKAEV